MACEQIKLNKELYLFLLCSWERMNFKKTGKKIDIPLHHICKCIGLTILVNYYKLHVPLRSLFSKFSIPVPRTAVVNNIQFLYTGSAFPCQSNLKALYILLPLADLLPPSPAQLPGEVYTRLKVPRVITVQLLSIARYSFMAERTKTQFLSPIVHMGRFLVSQLAYVGLKLTIFWLGV